MRTLSKSKLMAYRQCPKRLWLEIHKPELRDDSGAAAAFATGHAVGDVAQRVFDTAGNGVNLDPHAIGWDASAEQTAELMKKGGKAGFEALFRMPGAMALADVMRPDPDYSELCWEMIEVKASGSVKDYHRDDVAIQTYIAEQSGVRLSKSGLAHIDTSFVYQGDDNYDGLFHVEDLTEQARSRREEVMAWMQEAQHIVAIDAPPEVEVGGQCSEPYDCSFCAQCWKDVVVPEDPFAMLPSLRANKRAMFEAEGFERLEEIPGDWLSAKQARVQEAHLSGKVFFDADRAKASLDYEGPAYFLDFETLMFAVPIWKGSRPYQNLPFQYSLHRVDEDGSLHHMEFLDTSGGDPRRALAEQMIQDCGSEGAIFVYNAAFEKTRLAELSELYLDLSASLDALNARIVDLYPIAKDCYYNPMQGKSWSLKAVAPAIAPELSYDGLEGVKVGSDAGVAYLEAVAPETTPGRKEELRQQMLEYCMLDTLATVRIWEFFKKAES